jgi:hypothetical protein
MVESTAVQRLIFGFTDTNSNAVTTSIGVHEMQVFFAILLLFGMVKEPSVQDYWSSRPVLGSSFLQINHVLQPMLGFGLMTDTHTHTHTHTHTLYVAIH